MSNTGKRFLLSDTHPSTPGSAMAVSSGTPKEGTDSSNMTQDSGYDSEIDLTVCKAVQNLHIGSTHPHLRSTPNCKRPNPSDLGTPPVSIMNRKGERRRRRNATPDKEREKARTTFSPPDTPSPPSRCPPTFSSPVSGTPSLASAASDTPNSSDIEDVPRNLLRSHLSMTKEMAEGSNMEKRGLQKFQKEEQGRSGWPAAVRRCGELGGRLGGATTIHFTYPRLQRTMRELERITGQSLVEKGYEGDVGADEMMLLDGGSGTDQAGAGGWHDMDIEMEDVQPGPSRVAEENCGNSGFRKRKLQTTMEQREPQEESKGSKKRVRFTDEMDEDGGQVEHERRHKRPRSGEGSMDCR